MKRVPTPRSGYLRTWFLFVLLTTNVATVTALLWPLNIDKKLRSAEIGTIAELSGGLFAAVAVIVAVAALHQEALGRQRERIRGIASWLHPLLRNDESLQVDGLRPSEPGLYVILQNLTDSPIYSVDIVVVDERTPGDTTWQHSELVWAPGRRQAWKLADDGRWQPNETSSMLKLVATFSDSTGTRWELSNVR